MNDLRTIVAAYSNPGFRPHRRESYDIYKSITNANMGIVSPDDNLFTQDRIEILLDVVEMSRLAMTASGKANDITGQHITDSKLRSHGRAYLLYQEHSIICAAMNEMMPDLQMRPVVGRVCYTWIDHDRMQIISVHSGHPACTDTGFPVTWSESSLAGWNVTHEMKLQGVEFPWPNANPGPHASPAYKVFSKLGIGSPDENDEILEPFRVDTLMRLNMEQDGGPNTPEMAKQLAATLSKIVFHPMHHNNCIPTFFANGAQTAIFGENWGAVVRDFYKQVCAPRVEVYRQWTNQD